MRVGLWKKERGYKKEEKTPGKRVTRGKGRDL